MAELEGGSLRFQPHVVHVMGTPFHLQNERLGKEMERARMVEVGGKCIRVEELHGG